MKKITFIFLCSIVILIQPCLSFSQTVINLQKSGGVYLVPCTVNGIKLTFIFDTGASDVSISMTEAMFMIKNGYLNKTDILGSQSFSDANGDISVGTKIILRKIEFSGMILTNVEASVVNNIDAPLLFGQSAIQKLGVIQLDPIKNTLTILNGKNSEAPITTIEKKSPTLYIPKEKYLYIKTRDSTFTDCLLWKTPDSDLVSLYNIPKKSKVYILKENIISQMDAKFYYVYCDGFYGYIEEYFIRK